jgi:hypothetical protein
MASAREGSPASRWPTIIGATPPSAQVMRPSASLVKSNRRMGLAGVTSPSSGSCGASAGGSALRARRKASIRRTMAPMLLLPGGGGGDDRFGRDLGFGRDVGLRLDRVGEQQFLRMGRLRQGPPANAQPHQQGVGTRWQVGLFIEEPTRMHRHGRDQVQPLILIQIGGAHGGGSHGGLHRAKRGHQAGRTQAMPRLGQQAGAITRRKTRGQLGQAQIGGIDQIAAHIGGHRAQQVDQLAQLNTRDAGAGGTSRRTVARRSS